MGYKMNWIKKIEIINFIIHIMAVVLILFTAPPMSVDTIILVFLVSFILRVLIVSIERPIIRYIVMKNTKPISIEDRIKMAWDEYHKEKEQNNGD